MNIWEKVKFIFGTSDKFNEQITQLSSGNAPFDFSRSESISSVYTCIKVLSDTISRLPVNVYKSDQKKGRLKEKDHYLHTIVHYNPNNYTTSQAFFAALEAYRNFKGNAFAKIHRNQGSGRIMTLEIVNPDHVVGYNVIEGELFYKVQVSDKKTEIIPSSEMLHFRGLSKNGIWGINPIEALRLNLSSTHQALTTIDKFFQQGALSPYAMKSTVAGANQAAMLEALEKFQKKNAGATQAGKIIPLPPNTELQGLNMNMADAQFINTVKFNADQIASIYGVPSHLVGNNEASKYSNIEQSQISFKVNTVSAITRMYRQEMEFKMLTSKERDQGYSIEFNLMAMVETDHRTRLEGYRILANIGAIAPNKVAALEGLETYEGGDDHFIQTNLQSVEQMKKKNGQETIKTK